MKYEKPVIKILLLEQQNVITLSDGGDGPGGTEDGSDVFGVTFLTV